MVNLGNLRDQLITSKRLTPKNTTDFDIKSIINHNHTDSVDENKYITITEFEEELKKNNTPANFNNLKKNLAESINEYSESDLTIDTPFSQFHTRIDDGISYNLMEEFIKKEYKVELENLNLMNFTKATDNYLSILVEAHCLREAIEYKTGKSLKNIPLSKYSEALSSTPNLIIKAPARVTQYSDYPMSIEITHFENLTQPSLKISSPVFSEDIIINKPTKYSTTAAQVVKSVTGYTTVTFTLTYTLERVTKTYTYEQLLLVDKISRQVVNIVPTHTNTLYYNHELVYDLTTASPVVLDDIRTTVTCKDKTIYPVIRGNQLRFNVNDIISDDRTKFLSAELEVMIYIPRSDRIESSTLTENLNYKSHVTKTLENQKVLLPSLNCKTSSEGVRLTDWIAQGTTERPADYETSYTTILKGKGNLFCNLGPSNKESDCKYPIPLKLYPDFVGVEGEILTLETFIGYKTGASFAQSIQGFILGFINDDTVIWSEKNTSYWPTETGASITVKKKLDKPLSTTELNGFSLIFSSSSNELNKVVKLYLSELYLTVYYTPKQEFQKK